MSGAMAKAERKAERKAAVEARGAGDVAAEIQAARVRILTLDGAMQGAKLSRDGVQGIIDNLTNQRAETSSRLKELERALKESEPAGDDGPDAAPPAATPPEPPAPSPLEPAAPEEPPAGTAP